MRLSFKSMSVGHRNVFRFLLPAAIMATFAGICNAQDDDNDADDSFYAMRFIVPPVPESFMKSSPGGWGALVLTFNGPAAATGLEGATFQFLPACPGWTAGKVDDLASDFPQIQLGPGGYRLGQTGTQIAAGQFKGQFYDTFDVIVEYEKMAGVAPPVVTSAFWQNKLTLQSAPNPKPTTWTFDANAPDNPDLMVDVIPPQLPLVPEPSTFVLYLCGGGVLLVARRKLVRAPRREVA